MFTRIKIFVVVAILASMFVSAVPALASTQQDIGNQLKAAGDKAGVADPKDPRTIAMTIIRWAFGLLGTIFLCLTLYAGFKWMTAGGNEENVTKATDLLKQAVIGLAIILLSYSITFFVVKTITAPPDTGMDQYRYIF